MNATASAAAPPAKKSVPAWVGVVNPYKRPTNAAAIWQLTTTLVLYAGFITAAFWSLSVSYWLTLAIAIPTGGLVTRIFVLQHDCGHGSLFPKKRWNEFVGKCLGVLTFTPYEFWRKSHAIHHATSGDISRRGIGDVHTWTVKEFEALSRWEKIQYWLYRHPITMFGVFPVLLFFLRFRFAYRKEARFKKEAWSVYRTNACLVALACLAGFTLGWKAYLMVQIPVLWFAAMFGVWLFYVQHQYEETYWAQAKDWDYYTASIKGSSFLRLPKPIQWLTANIGVHHVHHLCPGIPNYRLQQCHDENPEMHAAKDLGMWEALGAAWLVMWDEDSQRLISFREWRKKRRAADASTTAAPAPA